VSAVYVLNSISSEYSQLYLQCIILTVSAVNILNCICSAYPQLYLQCIQVVIRMQSVFSQIKNRAGVLLHTTVFSNLFSAFLQQFKRGNPDPGVISHKCFSAIKKSSRGPPAFYRFFKFFQSFWQLKIFGKRTLIGTKKNKL